MTRRRSSTGSSRASAAGARAPVGLAFALYALFTLAGCNTSVMVDPEGHRCGDSDPCPTGYTCAFGSCRASAAAGGDATAGGFVLMGGGGGAVAGGAPGGGAAGGGSSGGNSAGGSAGGQTAGGAAGGDACANVSCAVVPAAKCDGTVARSFMAPGRCEPSTGQCVFPSFEVDCAPGSCAQGVCPVTVTQVGPRLRFAINAIDVAPGSTGATVLAVGNASNVAAWNGARWSTVNAPTTNVKLTAVNFTSQNLAWVVGDARTTWRWDRATSTFLSTPQPGLSATASLIGVDGINDTTVLVSDAQGNWAKWNGTAWTTGALPTTSASAFTMTSLWVDETSRERLGGSCNNSSGARRTCVAYRNPTGTSPTQWFIDTDASESRGCVSLGPWVDVPTSGGQDALCGFDDNGSIRHTSLGSYLASSLSLLTGDGIVGITGGPPSAGARTSWLLTSSILNTGRLYKLVGPASTGVPTGVLDTFFGEEHLSPSESAGVVVAEVDRVRGVNNVFYRRTTPTERTEALDLGLDFAAVTSFNNELTLLSKTGDLAVQHAGSDVYEFRRPPSSPQYNLEDADGRNGTQSVLVVGRDGLNAGLIGRVGFTGYTRLTTTAPGTTFRGVCRASDAEAWAVGTGGAVFAIGLTSATRDATVTTVNDLNAVDCPVVGQAVACGASSTVLRRQNGTWTPTPALPGGPRTVTSCKLVNGVIWVAGDQLFARLDPQATAWTMLPVRPGLNHLVVRAPNDIFATSAANTSNFDVVRYDGATWTTVLSGTSGVPGGGVQVGARVVWGASAGALIEGR